MIRKHNQQQKEYGNPDLIDGWIVKFFPYDTYGVRMDLQEIDSTCSVPSEMVKVPFTLVLHNYLIVLAQFKCEFWSGFVGLKQDATTFNTKPEIGWAINLIEEIKP
jgi:hypothetical protein